MDAIKATARDIGLVIRDHLEGSHFAMFEEIDGELEQSEES